MKLTKKLFAALIAVLMIVAVLPVASFAASAVEAQKLAMLADVWKPLEDVEREMVAMKAGPTEVARALYKAALNDSRIDEGSLVWESDEQFAFTVDGMHCAYNYRVGNARHISAVTPEIVKLITDVKGSNCGAAGTKDVLLVGPNYNESCTVAGYYDSSFTDQYMSEAQSIADATGGTCTMLGGHNATGPNIASNYMGKGVVIYDSHGSQSGTSSYLCLTTNSGINTTDYNNGWAVSYGSSEAWIDGRYIQNHVSGTLSNCFVWMAICEGMKKAGKGTTGTALLAAGAGAVYGYSQSVSFTGDYKYEATFWTQMKNGKTVAQAIATMKSTWGNWDPAYSSSSGAAWPIVMSAVDSFPSNPDSTQTVNCDWELFGETYTVSAVSNNTNWGTVSVTGSTITASPKAGYYLAGAEVISGTATFTISGNTISVNPSSDCTIRVNFAEKSQYTVNFVASGTSQGSQTAYTGDSITVPSTVTVNPDDWTFMGWVENQLAETTTKPTFYAPGASYTVNGNATLYALYTRVEGGTGEAIYQQTSTLAVGGVYAITAGNYAVSNTIYNTSNNHYVTSQSVTINSNTNTLTVGSSVDINTILYEVESGSASAGYVFKNVANGKYLTLGSDEYLIVGSTPLAWLWTGSDLNNQIDSEGYYYLSRSSSSAYFTTSKNTNGTIVMYEQVMQGTSYYCTDPVAQTTYYTVTFKNWDGTVLKTEQVEEGASATAPAVPARTGYTFTGWDVDFTNVMSDLVVTAQFTVNSYTLTINYLNEEDEVIAPAYTAQVAYGANFSVESPVIAGYTTTQTVVTGTMPASDYTVNVYYEAEPIVEPNLLGDVDCNGTVDMSDISMLFSYLNGTTELTEQGLANANANGDDTVNVMDITAIFNIIANS